MFPITTLLLLAFIPQTGSLAFTAPTGWQTRAPASTMRVAEFVVPKAAGDPEDAEVIIYFFGGTAGSVDANVQRWIAQFERPKGAPADGGRTSFNLGNLKVTTVDVSGTYIAEVRPGATERHNKPNYRMRAAVVETAKGPYFVKFTGPAATVAAGMSGFDAFLKSLRYQ
jgi:hypothetical protein